VDESATEALSSQERTEDAARPAADSKSAPAAQVGPGHSSWITEGSIPRAVFRLALPTWGAFLSHDLMGMVDMFFVGKLGASAVAAVAMSGAVFGIIIMLGHGITVGTTALVANAFGRGERDTAGHATGQTLSMAAVLSVVVAAAGISLAAAMLRLMGAEPDVVARGTGYLRVVSGGAFAMMVSMSLGATLRGAGDAMTPFRAMTIANVTNAVLDPIFIFGWLGFPALGVVGSAWATLVGRIVGAVLMMRAFISARAIVRLRLRDLRPRAAIMAQICRIGGFASGRMLVRNVAGLLLMRLVAMFGTVPVAAYGIGLRLHMVLFGPTMGFATAAGTMVGQNMGAGQSRRATRSAWIAAGIAMTVAFCITVVFWATAGFLVRVFNNDPEVVWTGTVLLRWFAASFVFLALAIVLGHAMNCAGDTLRPMIITTVALVVTGVPLAYALATLWNSVEGIWVALFTSNVLAGLLSAAVFRRGRWRATSLQRSDG